MIAQFALRLICGMSLMWAFMPRREVSSGFFRIQMLVVMGLAVLAALTCEATTEPSILISAPILQAVASALAVWAFLGSVFWTLERRALGELAGFGLLAVSTGLLLLQGVHVSEWVTRVDWLSPLSQLAGAGVLGGTVVGMLLGHWYLTAPTMSIDPLKRINQFLGIAGLVRLSVSGFVLISLWMGQFDFADAPPRWLAVPKVWLGLRWLAGVFGPLVVFGMVSRILKYRNTQAATGVLFVGVILAFLGDMVSELLVRETRVPF